MKRLIPIFIIMAFACSKDKPTKSTSSEPVDTLATALLKVQNRITTEYQGHAIETVFLEVDTLTFDVGRSGQNKTFNIRPQNHYWYVWVRLANGYAVGIDGGELDLTYCNMIMTIYNDSTKFEEWW